MFVRTFFTTNGTVGKESDFFVAMIVLITKTKSLFPSVLSLSPLTEILQGVFFLAGFTTLGSDRKI